MRPSLSLSPTRFIRLVKSSSARLLRRKLERRIVCFAVVFNLLLWPGPGLVSEHVFDAVAQGASIVLDTRLLSASYEAYFITAAPSPSTPSRAAPVRASHSASVGL
jgi:hypothetical protein